MAKGPCCADCIVRSTSCAGVVRAPSRAFKLACISKVSLYCVDEDFGPLFAMICSYNGTLHQRTQVLETPVCQVRGGQRFRLWTMPSSAVPNLGCYQLSILHTQWPFLATRASSISTQHCIPSNRASSAHLPVSIAKASALACGCQRLRTRGKPSRSAISAGRGVNQGL